MFLKNILKIKLQIVINQIKITEYQFLISRNLMKNSTKK